MALVPRNIYALAALAVLYTSSAWANDPMPDMYHHGNISYLSGGIGEDEKEQMELAQHNFNLRIINADKMGHFSGDTHIIIRDIHHAVLLDTTSGPMFYASLPSGRYRVEGISGEQHKEQNVTIATEKTTHIRFMWPEESSEFTQY
jgi:hypothetical protein